MSEKNYVVNVKNKQGTIVTFRGDTTAELKNAIETFIDGHTEILIGMVENTLLGSSASPIDVVTQTLGATVVSETPAFAPVPPPASPTGQSAVGARMCNHGPMVARKGNGAKGEWKGLFCPTPKGTVGQCEPVWLNRSMPEWSTI